MPQATSPSCPGAGPGNADSRHGGRCPRGATSRRCRRPHWPRRGPAAAAAAPAVPPPVPMLVPAQSGTLRDYFASKSVAMEPQKPQNFKALDFSLPMPPGWTQVPDPNVPDAFVVTANSAQQQLLHLQHPAGGVPAGRRFRSQGSHHSWSAISTARNCPPGAAPTPRCPTSTARPRRSSRAPTARTR